MGGRARRLRYDSSRCRLRPLATSNCSAIFSLADARFEEAENTVPAHRRAVCDVAQLQRDRELARQCARLAAHDLKAEVLNPYPQDLWAAAEFLGRHFLARAEQLTITNRTAAAMEAYLTAHFLFRKSSNDEGKTAVLAQVGKNSGMFPAHFMAGLYVLNPTVSG